MVATTLGSSRDRPYLNRLLFRLRELLLHKLQAFRISGGSVWTHGRPTAVCFVCLYVCMYVCMMLHVVGWDGIGLGGVSGGVVCAMIYE